MSCAISTAAFAGVALLVGLRLVALSRRTGQVAERLLGLGLLLTAALGYGVMMIAVIGRARLADPANAPAIYTVVTTFGWLCHNVGVMCMLGFLLRVFRPGVAWARALAAWMALVLWVGWAAFVADGGMRDGLPRAGYWLSFVTIGSYPFWLAAESFAYYARMRRRMALGLAEPLLANRFLLWGLASVTAALSIWVVNVPALVGAGASAGGSALLVVCILITSALGIATVSIYWLTFFPPSWYRRRLASAAV